MGEKQDSRGIRTVLGTHRMLARVQWIQVLVQLLPLETLPLNGDRGGKGQQGQLLQTGLAPSFPGGTAVLRESD